MNRPSGAFVVTLGLGVLLACFLVAVFHYRAAADVSTALAAVSGTVGTLVGAYFGVQAGAASGQRAADQANSAYERAERARAQLESARTSDQRVALQLAGATDPERANQLLLQLPPAGDADQQQQAAAGEAVVDTEIPDQD